MKKKKQMVKPHIKKGDIVEALAGADTGGKTGKVLQVMPQKGVAVVEGFNLVKKCMRKSQDNPQGGIVEKEAPIALSNLRVSKGAAKKGSVDKK